MGNEIKSELIKIASRLLTTNQFPDINDLYIHKGFGRRRWIKLHRIIESHNEALKIVAINLKKIYDAK